MLKKHLSILFLLVMAVGAYAQSIPSGTARFEALGFNPFIMDAATDINRNPAWGGVYRHYSFGDIGRIAEDQDDKDYYRLPDQYAGVNFGVSKQWNAGLVLNRQEGQVFGGFGGSFRTYYTSLGIQAPIVPLEVLIGYTNNKKTLSIGLAPYYSRWSQDSTTTGPGDDITSDRSSMILGGTIGVVGKMKSGWWEASVDARLNKYKFERTTQPDSGTGTSVTDESKGGFEINANLRGFFLVNKPAKVNLVPYVSFGIFNWEPDRTPVTTTDEYKELIIRGGVGVNMPILGDGMLAGGLSVGYSSVEFTSSDTTGSFSGKITDFVLPQFNIGGEWKFNDWITGRFGYARAVTNRKTEVTSTSGSVSSTGELNQTLASDPNQTITLGLGWHFDRFSLDGLIGERFFQGGPYIFGGKRNDLYGVLSASYNFNK
ncbi:MAG: hypothetical protein ACRDFC_02940 [Ignavibacteria bacterium]